jgi:mRNA-degrading endonuclease RelE of RelBE toxin-antitoxin system
MFILYNSMYIEWTSDDIKNAHVIVLKGSGFWLIFQPDEQEHVVYLIAIDHRKRVYKE